MSISETRSELISIYQQAHEELIELEAHSPTPYDQTPAALTIRQAIAERRQTISEIRKELSGPPG